MEKKRRQKEFKCGRCLVQTRRKRSVEKKRRKRREPYKGSDEKEDKDFQQISDREDKGTTAIFYKHI